MRLIGLILLTIFLFGSCAKDNITTIYGDEDTGAKLLWTSSITDSEYVQGQFNSEIVDDKLIISGMVDNNGVVMAKDVETGENIWVCNDFQSGFPLASNKAVISDDIFIGKHRSFMYGLNLSNGTIDWKVFDPEVVGYAQNLTQFEDDFFFSAPTIFNDTLWGVVYKGDFLTGEVEEFITPSYADEESLSLSNVLGQIKKMELIYIENQPKLLLNIMECDENWYCPSYLSLLDVETMNWDYELKPVIDTVGNVLSFLVEGDFIYIAKGQFVSCHHVKSGEQIWTREFDGIIGKMIVSLEEDKIIVQRYSNDQVYGLDLSSGNISWVRDSSGGLSTQMYTLNGVVYLLNSRFHAFDISTGEYLWQVEGIDENGDLSFRTGLTGIPGKNGGKGKIFVKSFLNVFCFEAAR